MRPECRLFPGVCQGPTVAPVRFEGRQRHGSGDLSHPPALVRCAVARHRGLHGSNATAMAFVSHEYLHWLCPSGPDINAPWF